MRSMNEPLGRYIQFVDERNADIVTENLQGISIEKYFMPSVGNVIGTDLSKYKLLRKGRFACNPMHVGRDERLPISLFVNDEPAIVSPAYFMFEIIDKNILDAEYLMLCFRRFDFDHQCWFRTDASVRGGLSWEDLCSITIPIISISEQRRIVNSTNVISKRIELLNELDQKLAVTMQAIYTEWFVNYALSADEPRKQTKIGEIPASWEVKRLTDLMSYAGGQQPPASEFVFQPQNGYIRLVQIRDYETNKYATYIPISSSNKLCNERDIMIARYGVSLGRICFGLSGAYNVALAKVIPNLHYYREYLRCFLNSDTFYKGINGSGERSAQQGFNQSGMDAFLLPVPPDGIMKRFEALMSPMFEYRLSLRSEIEHLKAIRNMVINNLA